MSTAATTTFRLAPIDPATADALRVTGDQRYVADSSPATPVASVCAMPTWATS